LHHHGAGLRRLLALGLGITHRIFDLAAHQAAGGVDLLDLQDRSLEARRVICAHKSALRDGETDLDRFVRTGDADAQQRCGRQT
jgi:hypothetical protein